MHKKPSELPGKGVLQSLAPLPGSTIAASNHFYVPEKSLPLKPHTSSKKGARNETFAQFFIPLLKSQKLTL
jgi:hypothetical protein